jgi:hypothetical protein
MSTWKFLIEGYVVGLVLVVFWNVIVPALFGGQARAGHEALLIPCIAAAILGLARGITYAKQ